MVEVVDLSTLGEQEQTEAMSLLQRYCSVFSAHDGNLGCTNLLSHEIPLIDQVPFLSGSCMKRCIHTGSRFLCEYTFSYRCIPPLEYEVIKAHTASGGSGHKGEQ